MNEEEKRDYELLLHTLANLAESMSKHKMGDYGIWEMAKGLFLKFVYHCGSVYTLYEDEKYIDPASIGVLARCALESLAVFNYIYVIKENENELYMKYMAWLLSGSKYKQKLKTVTSESENKLKNEIEFSEEIISKLKCNESFKQLHIDQQREIMKGNWKIKVATENEKFRVPPDKEIAQYTGISKDLIDNIYNYYSAYVHSSSWSIDQILLAKEPEEKKQLLIGTVSTMKILMAFMVKKWITVFPDASSILHNNPVAEETIETWFFIGQSYGKGTT